MLLAVYVFKIQKREDFAKCSNFLCKFINKELISMEEADNVTFETIESITVDGKSICNAIINQKIQTKQILRPISHFIEKYKPLFIIRMDEKDMDEIVVYQDAILIQSYFTELPIYCIVDGKKDFYFKLSQFLFSAIQEKQLEEMFYYHEYGERFVKRIQKQNLEMSTSFFPLLLVTKENVDRLKSNCIEQVGEKSAKWVFRQKHDSIKESTGWGELNGIVKLFVKNKRVFKDIPGEYLYDVIQKLDTLSLILLAYSMKDLAEWQEKVFCEELKGYIDVIQQYANVCFQLLENILFHSDAGWGVLSVRVHRTDEKADSKYLSDTYGKIRKEKVYFEVIIRDYTGRMLSGNIAEHFQNELEARGQVKFDQLTPRNMFCSSLEGHDEFKQIWKQFYYKPENIGKHFGLRVFQRIVSDYNGYFVAESHKRYQCEEGDRYCYNLSEKNADLYVLPGTGYHILLPLKKMQKRIMIKNEIRENGNWLCNRPYEFFELKAEKFDAFIKKDAFQTQLEKEDYIKTEAKRLEDFAKGKKNTILTIDVSRMCGSDAELSLKILVIALYAMEEKPHIILHDCTKEFIDQFIVLIQELYDINLEGMFARQDFQIILLSDQYMETVFLPGNIKKTDCLNLYISRLRGMGGAVRIRKDKVNDVTEFVSSYIPADVFVKEGTVTLFQKCVQQVLQKDIQKEELGCQIRDTHMRLGSTIHINHFFEAEILLGIKYFRSRFEYLILRDLLKDIKEESYITLYGYASYSEPLLVELKNAIETINTEQYVDYIVLEREEERRGFSHKDRIRYSDQRRVDALECVKGVKKAHKYIVVVPINSTLKTHQRLTSLLEEQDSSFDKKDIIKNYALILVGPEDENEYWERIDDDKLQCKFADITPNPVYYVNVAADYNEPLTCQLCFPDNPLLEEPLIEVNAASTIPNQSFGFVNDKKSFDKAGLDRIQEIIKKQEEELADLEQCSLYGHFERNDAHYMHYILTEKLVTLASEKIVASLRRWKADFSFKQNEHHILVVPMHYSNCGFVEMVNREVFFGMASILRVDFKKDFRSNTSIKYSYIRHNIQQLSKAENTCLKFHYVDDCIITGRTYNRAKSLVGSIVSDRSEYNAMNVEIKIFDRVFVLVDRNSSETKKQYISEREIKQEEIDRYYYKYIQLEISSLRNYGDSCIVCNLYREAELLNRTATTEIVAKNWDEKKIAFGIKPIEEAADCLEPEYRQRAFRRLLSTHIVKVVMSVLKYNHKKENAAVVLLAILNQDYENRIHTSGREEAFEYFISYLKVSSRPFLSFDKSLKEAVFDILLNVICCLVDDRYSSMPKKDYWNSREIQKEWEAVENGILQSLDMSQKRQLLLVAMKQLTELKSNYIIRSKSIQYFERFISSGDFDEKQKEDFWNRYHILVKRLTGVSSDTSKSYWLDHLCYHEKEFCSEENDGKLECNPKVKEILILENTRNFQDGIEKIYQRLCLREDRKKTLRNYENALLHDDYQNLCLLYILEQKEPKLSKLARAACIEELQNILSENCACPPNSVESIFDMGLGIKESIEACKDKLRENIGLTEKMEETIEESLLQLKKQYPSRDYQFKNFQRFCGEVGWYGDGEYTEDGRRQIAGCLGIKDICEESGKTDEEIETRLKKFVNLSAEIMNYGQVQLLVECENSAEYYKEQIEIRYKEAIQKSGKGEALSLDKKGCYRVLASSTGDSAYMTEEIQEYLNNGDILSKIKKYGYYYEKERFIWRLGCPDICPIFLYVKYTFDKTMIYRIRNLMMLKWDLEHSIFAKEKLGYLQELASANSRLELYKSRKTITHTDVSTRRLKFQELISRLDGRKENFDYSRDNMDMLILLADIRVSDIYRQSLDRDFYNTSDRFHDVTWKSRWNMLKNKSIKESVETEDGVEINIHNEGLLFDDCQLGDEDKLTATEYTADELFSLLLAMVLNPCKNKRGKKNEEGKFDIYISKTIDNTIRITNPTICEESILPKIQRSLEHKPTRDEEGITLWSMNCYLKRVKVAYAGEILKITKETKGGLADAGERIQKMLTEKGYQIRVGIESKEKNKYFWCEIPVLSRKYEELKRKE